MERSTVFDKNILSSAHINFLFGAGVNGDAFRQLNGFKETLKLMGQKGASVNDGFENAVNSLPEKDLEAVKGCFIDEFEGFSKTIDYTNDSIVNLKDLLRKTHQVVGTTQNRNYSMKQINIYSLNYDMIVETVLSDLGYFYNSVSASNINTKAHLINVIGYDYEMGKHIPSFAVSKLHGDIDNPILPGKNKFVQILNEDYFEIVFHMKEQLSKPNSILIVIGYSGNDEHINKILLECVNHGLMVYWYKYTEEDRVIGLNDSTQLIIRDQDDYNCPLDTTRVCFRDLEKTWAEKSEELSK